MQKSEQGEREVVSKFSRQAADLGAVFIYKEGLFARAYEKDFTRRCAKNHQFSFLTSG